MEMSSGKKIKTFENESEENLPFDIYDSDYSTRVIPSENNGNSFMDSKSSVRVASNTGGTALNEYDVDDEEDFISTVLKPSDKPYDLRSKIYEANRELANASESKFVNVPGKVKFDNTVVVLDSFEDIGTVSIGTETLQGAEVIISNHPIDDTDDKDILAKIDLLRDDDADDQNDVVCSSATDRTQDTDTDDKAYSSTSFSRSFSTDSDDPLFINVIESGDEFKTIMDRNKTRQGSAIDEHVTYFPELFTHTQYKMYENCAEKPLEEGDVNIYVPKKLDAEELRNKLKEISGERKRAVQVAGVLNDRKVDCRPMKKVGCFASLRNVQKKIKQNIKTSEKKVQPSSALIQQQIIHCSNSNNNNNNNNNNITNNNNNINKNNKARVTYYFEMDPKGKLKPLNSKNNRQAVDETNSSNNCNDKSANRFFHINLRAAKNGENAKPRITKTPNADLFLEFQTDKSGNNKGAKLVIKKKQSTAGEELQHSPTSLSGGGIIKKSSAAGSGERPRLPGYNGLRSEYGLSAEQLLERRNTRMERERRKKELRQKKHEEEQKKRAENEKNFYKWLQQKKQLKKQAKTIRRSYPMNRLTVSSTRVSINSIHDNDRRKGSFALEELLKIKDENSEWFKF